MLWGTYIPFLLAKQSEQSREKQISFLQTEQMWTGKIHTGGACIFQTTKKYIIHIVRKKQDNYQNV